MIELNKLDFIEEIKAEMAGYEEIEPEHIDDWVERFEEYVSRKNLKSKKIKMKSGKLMICIEDESALFQIVDQYLAAIENEEMEQYWKDWTF